jgi:PemK-like, MazF-like toxin of type II toxin-antitoxin system
VRRGELYTYEPQGSPRQQLVVIVSSDGVNDSSRSWLLGVPVRTDDPQDILAVSIEGHGWADVASLTRFYRRWLVKRVDALDSTVVEQLDTAMRAALDL